MRKFSSLPQKAQACLAKERKRLKSANEIISVCSGSLMGFIGKALSAAFAGGQDNSWQNTLANRYESVVSDVFCLHRQCHLLTQWEYSPCKKSASLASLVTLQTLANWFYLHWGCPYSLLLTHLHVWRLFFCCRCNWHRSNNFLVYYSIAISSHCQGPVSSLLQAWDNFIIDSLAFDHSLAQSIWTELTEAWALAFSFDW